MAGEREGDALETPARMREIAGELRRQASGWVRDGVRVRALVPEGSPAAQPAGAGTPPRGFAFAGLAGAEAAASVDELTGACAPDDAAAVVLAAQLRRVDGGARRGEAQMMTVVARSGWEAHAFGARIADSDLVVVGPQEAAAPRGRDGAVEPSEGASRGGRRVAGRAVDRCRRALGLATAPPWPEVRDWLLGWWAATAADVPDAAADRERYARFVVDLLPDRLLGAAIADRYAPAEAGRQSTSMRAVVEEDPDRDRALRDATVFRVAAWTAVRRQQWDVVVPFAERLGVVDAATARWMGGPLLATDTLAFALPTDDPAATLEARAWQVADALGETARRALAVSVSLDEAAQRWDGASDLGSRCEDLAAETGGDAAAT